MNLLEIAAIASVMMFVGFGAGFILVHGIPPAPSDEICTNYEHNWGITHNRPVSFWEENFWGFYRSTCECHWDYVCYPGYENRSYCHIERCVLLKKEG